MTPLQTVILKAKGILVYKWKKWTKFIFEGMNNLPEGKRGWSFIAQQEMYSNSLCAYTFPTVDES